eukprot:7297619-Prymnesium_polylepis.1
MYYSAVAVRRGLPLRGALLRRITHSARCRLRRLRAATRGEQPLQASVFVMTSPLPARQPRARAAPVVAVEARRRARCSSRRMTTLRRKLDCWLRPSTGEGAVRARCAAGGMRGREPHLEASTSFGARSSASQSSCFVDLGRAQPWTCGSPRAAACCAAPFPRSLEREKGTCVVEDS